MSSTSVLEVMVGNAQAFQGLRGSCDRHPKEGQNLARAVWVVNTAVAVGQELSISGTLC